MFMGFSARFHSSDGSSNNVNIYVYFFLSHKNFEHFNERIQSECSVVVVVVFPLYLDPFSPKHGIPDM